MPAGGANSACQHTRVKGAKMIIVDTHLHADIHHFEPIEVALFQMDRNGVSKAVLLQGGGNLDNTYLMVISSAISNTGEFVEGGFSPVINYSHQSLNIFLYFLFKSDSCKSLILRNILK